MRRLRWALIGAGWMGICLALHAAYDKWVRWPLMRMGDPEPGPDVEFPPVDSLWGALDHMVLIVLLPKVVFPLLAFGVLAAGWWVIKRVRAKRAQVVEL